MIRRFVRWLISRDGDDPVALRQESARLTREQWHHVMHGRRIAAEAERFQRTGNFYRDYLVTGRPPERMET